MALLAVLNKNGTPEGKTNGLGFAIRGPIITILGKKSKLNTYNYF
jgi:hypothetical protein